MRPRNRCISVFASSVFCRDTSDIEESLALPVCGGPSTSHRMKLMDLYIIPTTLIINGYYVFNTTESILVVPPPQILSLAMISCADKIHTAGLRFIKISNITL